MTDNVVKIELTKPELEDASFVNLDREDYERSIFFIKTAIDRYNDPQDYFYLADIYNAMQEYDYSNKILFRLYADIGDDNLLMPIVDNMFKLNDFLSVVKYLRNNNIDLHNIDTENIESMQKFSMKLDVSNTFGIIYPPTDTYFLGVLNYAKMLSQNGDYEESNKVLGFRDYSFSEYYAEAVVLKAQNLIMLDEISELIDYCYDIIDGKYEAYARLYLVYCYYSYGFIGSAKVHLSRLFELNPDDEVLIELTKILGETNFTDESMRIADIFIGKYPYSIKANMYKAAMLYLLGDKRQAIKLINKCISFEYEFELYFLKDIFLNGYRYSTLNELLYDIYAVAGKYVRALLKNPKRNKLVQRDISTQRILGYCLRSENNAIIRGTLKLLTENYCPEIRAIFEDALLDNYIENNIKATILKNLITLDDNKIVNCVYDNFFTTFDYSLPKELSGYDNNIIDGYYRAVFFSFSASITPFNDIEKIKKRIKTFTSKLNGKEDCPLKKHNSKIIGALMCFDENDKEILGNLDVICHIFKINKNTFYRIYKKCRPLLED